MTAFDKMFCLSFRIQTGHDVFNALDLMENQSYLKDLKFGPGDGNLHYYLYNFKCPELTENEVLCLFNLFFVIDCNFHSHLGVCRS